jgi:hypothetical protein
MPYLHFETDTKQVKMNEAIKRVTNASSGGTQIPDPLTDSIDEKLIRAYLRPTSDWQTPSLHIRRTLDQYFYTTLDNTNARDRDQVLRRHTGSEIIMVDQLWLWIVEG